MFGLGATELVIILVIALVIFGGAKLRHLGGDLGGAISEFKKSVSSDNADEKEGAKKEETTSAASTSAAPEEKPVEQ